MIGLAVAAGLLVVIWLLSVVLDAGSREHLAWVGRDEAFFTLDAELERRGHRVNDTTLLSRYAHGSARSAWIYPGLVLVGGGLAAEVAGLPVVVVAIAMGVLLGAYGSFDEFVAPFFGVRDQEGERAAGEWRWFFAGIAGKILLAGFASWVFLRGLTGVGQGAWASGIGLILGAYAGFFFAHLPAVWAARRARRLRRGGFGDTASAETILLLRSFSDDDLRMRTMLAVAGPASPIFPLSYVRFEEHLARVLSVYGDLVAIGRPDEGLPELGAVRTYWADDQWQGAVRLTASRAKAIVLIAGASDGLAWELSLLREWDLLAKTLVLMPPDPHKERSTRRLLHVYENLNAGAFPVDLWVPEIWTAVQFDPQGGMVHFVADGRDWANYLSTVVGFFRELDGGKGLRQGIHAEAQDRIEAAVAHAETPEEALSLFRASQSAPETGVGPRTFAYGLTKVERLPLTRSIRVWRVLGPALVDADEGRHAEAAAAFLAVAPLTETPRTPLLHAVCQTLAAESLIETGDLDRARSLLDAAWVAAERCEKRLLIMFLSTSPVDLQFRILDAQIRAAGKAKARADAIAYLERKLELAHVNQVETQQLDAHYRLGDLLLELRRDDQGEAHLRSALDLARRTGASDELIRVSWRLACLRADAGDLDQGLLLMEEGSLQAERRGEFGRQSRVLTRAAGMLDDAGRFRDAHSMYGRAWGAAQRDGSERRGLDGESGEGGADEASEAVLTAAERHLRRVLNHEADAPDRIAALRDASTLERWMETIGHADTRLSRDLERALAVALEAAGGDDTDAHHSRSLDLTRQLLAAAPDGDKDIRTLVEELWWAADRAMSQEPGRARALHLEAVETARQAFERQATAERSALLFWALLDLARASEGAVAIATLQRLVGHARGAVAARLGSPPRCADRLRIALQELASALGPVAPDAALRASAEALSLHRSLSSMSSARDDQLAWVRHLYTHALRAMAQQPGEAVLHATEAAESSRRRALDDPDFGLVLLRSLTLLAGLHGEVDPARSLELTAEALRLARRMEPAAQGEWRVTLLLQRAAMLGPERSLQRRASVAEAIVICRDQVAAADPDAESDLVRVLCVGARYARGVDLDESLTLAREAVDISARRLTVAPHGGQRRLEHAFALNALACAELDSAPARSVRDLEEGLADARRAVEANPMDATAASVLGTVAGNLCAVRQRLGLQIDQDLLREAEAQLRRVAVAMPGWPSAQLDLGWLVALRGDGLGTSEAGALRRIAVGAMHLVTTGDDVLPLRSADDASSP